MNDNRDSCFRCTRLSSGMRWFYTGLTMDLNQLCRQCVDRDILNDWDEGYDNPGCHNCHSLTEDVRLFCPEELDLHTLPRGINFFCRRCIEGVEGDWEEGISDYESSDSDTDDDTYDYTDDETVLSDYGRNVINRVRSNRNESQCMPSSEHSKIIMWESYDFTQYTTDTYNDWCYKYGLKLVGE